MRLYLTYFPLLLLTLTLTFYVKSTVIVPKHTDYELNLKRKNLSQILYEVLQVRKIKVVKKQSEIESEKYHRYS